MNKNFTQKELRNFLSRISDFFKNLPVLPANLRLAGNLILIQFENPVHHHPVSISTTVTFFNTLNKRKPQLRCIPLVSKQY